jgi:DNA-binding transcriptional LysR family regulator
MYPGAVELRLLRYVVTVAEELNFTRAAERLNTSQPSLSRQILELEKSLGVELFHRSKRWVELTPAGRRFASEARRALVHAERAAVAAKQIKQTARATYTVGYCPCLDLRFLSALRRIRPIDSTHFVLRNADYSELVAKVVTHEWEAALMLLPVREPELAAESLFREPLSAAVPASHPLAKKRELDVTDLRGEPILLAPRCYGPAFGDYLLHQLEQAGTHVMSHEAASPHEALHLVEEGFGIALAQESVLSAAKEHIALCRIKGSNTEVETGVVFHEENDSPSLQKFLDAVRHIRDRYLQQHPRDLRISA